MLSTFPGTRDSHEWRCFRKMGSLETLVSEPRTHIADARIALRNRRSGQPPVFTLLMHGIYLFSVFRAAGRAGDGRAGPPACSGSHHCPAAAPCAFAAASAQARRHSTPSSNPIRSRIAPCQEPTPPMVTSQRRAWNSDPLTRSGCLYVLSPRHRQRIVDD